MSNNLFKRLRHLRLRPLDLAIRNLDLFSARHASQPLEYIRVLVQRQPGELELAHPRLKVVVHGSHLLRQDARTSGLAQLPFQNLVAAVRLLGVALQGVIVGGGVVVSW